MLIHRGHRDSGADHLLGHYQPFLNDVPVYRGTHQTVELPGQMIFADKEFIGKKIQGQIFVVMVASLFLKVSDEEFDKKVKNMYIDVAKEIGENIPIEVANDGDVTALAGAMDLNDNAVLGVAMGTSEAGGYVDPQGNITGWLNELAFVPVDYCENAMVDEWSGDYGCGVTITNRRIKKELTL